MSLVKLLVAVDRIIYIKTHLKGAFGFSGISDLAFLFIKLAAPKLVRSKLGAFMDIIPSTAPKSLTSNTTSYNYLLIVDAYSKIPKLYGMEKITTEEVMDKIDMFQSRSCKNRRIWMVGFRKNISRCREAVYLDGVKRRIP